MAAGEDIGRCAALDRAIRLAILGELKAGGVTDAGAMALIEKIMARLGKMAAINAIGVIMSLDQVARQGGSGGLSDLVSGEGGPYQSATLADALAVLRGAS